jgi:hypothetical protein
MKRSLSMRVLMLPVLAALSATSLAVVATPAWASTSTVGEVVPQSGPTAGGNAVRRAT